MSTATTSIDRPPVRLGTFAGVFTPSVLTILGIILFLRMGYVVGEAGLGKALIIIAIANGISVLTSISLSAIATNLRVKAGGDYYVISRTLGVAFGGALGIVLFLSQAISIAFYAIGFGEAVAAMIQGSPAWLAQAVAAGAVAVLFVLAWAGSDWATRFQYVVMAVLAAAIASFFVGAFGDWDAVRFESGFAREGTVPFWAVFAIFFPAVTGFTQGVSMSGDLEDPGRSIPRGTFLAVGLSAAVYFGVAVAFAGALTLDELSSDYGAMRRVSYFTWLADAGVIAATLSSALASFLGAPRILQSLAKDKIFPGLTFFAKGSGALENPRRGVVLSALIAFTTIALGDLNLVAPVVSMFFLISYGLLNYATYYEARSRSPYFRPRFRWFHKNLCLAGALACLVIMFLLEPLAAAGALVILWGIFTYLRRSVKHERWADSSRSARFQSVRESLHGIHAEIESPRDWRPVLLAFSSNSARRERNLRFAHWLEGESGLTTAVQILVDKGGPARVRRQEAEAALRTEIKAREVDAFPLVISAASVQAALPILIQSHGLGPIRANTVLLNWYDGPQGPAGEPGLRSYTGYLRTSLSLGCNVIVLEATADEFASIDAQRRDERRIDILYVSDASSRLMLLFAYLMTRTEEWGQATIRLLVPVGENLSREQTLENLSEMLDEVRIDAQIEVLDRLAAAEVTARVADATLVFLPFHFRGEEISLPFPGDAAALLDQLPMTAMVLAAQDVVLDAEPDEGVHGEIAEALDTAERTGRVARVIEKATAEARQKVESARSALADARRGEAEAREIERLESELAEAEADAERTMRRALKAKVKADAAAVDMRRVTGTEDETPERR